MLNLQSLLSGEKSEDRKMLLQIRKCGMCGWGDMVRSRFWGTLSKDGCSITNG